MSDVDFDAPRLTQAQYSRHRGVKRQTIWKMVQSGRLALGSDNKLDVVEADRLLGETRMRVDEPPEGSGGSGGGPPASGESLALTKARTATEIYKARNEQLTNLERLNKLRTAADVEQSAAMCAGRLKQGLDLLPAMVDDLAAAYVRGGVDALRAALKAKRDDLLRTLSAAMVALQGRPPDVRQ